MIADPGVAALAHHDAADRALIVEAWREQFQAALAEHDHGTARRVLLVLSPMERVARLVDEHEAALAEENAP